MRKYLLILSSVALLFASCVKDDVDRIATNDGAVRFMIDLDGRDFTSQAVDSRAVSGVPMIATAAETTITNAYAFVFTYPSVEAVSTDYYGGVLTQCVPAVHTTVGDKSYYMAELKSTNKPALVIGVANITTDVIDNIGALNQYKFADLKSLAEMVYTNDEFSTVLKKSHNAKLPLYSSALVFTSADSDGNYLSQSSLEDNVTPNGYFVYARVDVTLDSAVDSNFELVSMQATNVRHLPWGAAGAGYAANASTESHVVTPATNEPQSTLFARYPAGINDTNYQSRYIQGLYMHPTTEAPRSFGAPVNNISPDDAIEVVVGLKKSADSETVYYKIRMKYKYTYEGNTSTTEIYDIFSNNRYLINIRSVNSPGYPTYEEAKAAPASNTALDFDITIDGGMSSVASNGQYYLAVETENYWAKGDASESPMLAPKPSIDSFSPSDENCNNVNSWSFDDVTKLFTLTVNFVLNDGDQNLVGGDSDDIKGILTSIVDDLPDGVTTDASQTAWGEKFGEYSIDLTIDPERFKSGSMTMRVGELTRTINIDLSANTVTDYTDEDIFEELTGLKSGVSNCYILVPAGKAEAVYYLPIAERVNEYWGDPTYGGDASKVIPDGITEADWSSQYEVKRLWHDGKADEDHMLKYELTMSPKTNRPALKVTIPADYQNQNVGVRLSKAGSSDILWSWHLWVTDYNPYITKDGTPVWKLTTPQPYVKVPGGDGSAESPDGYLHRYHDHTYDPYWYQHYYVDACVWDGPPSDPTSAAYPRYSYKNYTGYYESSYIMDRNIGAIEATYEGQGNCSGDGVLASNYDRGILCYQFGRKDPFPGARTLDHNEDINEGFEYVQVTGTMKESVANPMKFYYEGADSDWNQDNIDNPLFAEDYLWNDPAMVRDINALEWNQYCVPNIRADWDGNYGGFLPSSNSDITKAKSLFDPSPLGWCVPIDATWNDFDNVDVVWANRGGEYVVDGNIKAYYPASGYIYGSEGSGKFGSGEMKGFYWSSSPNAVEPNKGRYMLIQDGSMQSVLSAVRSNGYPVRPIMERPANGREITEL